MSAEVRIVEPGNLECGGEIIDLFQFERCLDFRYVAKTDSNDAACVITLCRADNSVLQLHLDGVTHLHLPDIGAQFWFSELEVMDGRASQLEGVRFRFVSNSGFVCHCLDVRLGERRN